MHTFNVGTSLHIAEREIPLFVVLTVMELQVQSALWLPTTGMEKLFSFIQLRLRTDTSANDAKRLTTVCSLDQRQGFQNRSSRSESVLGKHGSASRYVAR